jgi:uncharacterized protein YeaO (DUF488 family)
MGGDAPGGLASPACLLHETDPAWATGARIGLRRAWDSQGPDEGWRALVDRIWPRGVARARLGLDEWAKDLAPSDELRRWFAHDPARWETFRLRYRAELTAPERAGALEALLRRAGSGPVTLIYGARDRARNNAVVMRERLLERLAGRA